MRSVSSVVFCCGSSMAALVIVRAFPKNRRDSSVSTLLLDHMDVSIIASADVARER